MEIIKDNGKYDLTLVEKEKKTFKVITTEQLSKDEFKITQAHINIHSKEVDQDEVAMFANFAEDDFDVFEFAAACLEYYGPRYWKAETAVFNKKEIEKFLSKQMEKVGEE